MSKNDNDKMIQPVTRPDTSQAAAPDATIPLWALRWVTAQSERAVEETAAQLRDTERTRDDLARQLGATQDLIDALKSEMDRRSKLLRQLLSISPGVNHDQE